jgi:hypothetical protein
MSYVEVKERAWAWNLILRRGPIAVWPCRYRSLPLVPVLVCRCCVGMMRRSEGDGRSLLREEALVGHSTCES